jgi:uncharacterized membrane protein
MVQEDEGRHSVDRLVAFSDGVFAFAMTLLIINVLPLAPSATQANDSSIVHALTSPNFRQTLLTFALSFFLIGLTCSLIAGFSAMS